MARFWVEVLTEWRVVNGGNEMGIALDHPTHGEGWTDVTGQPDANLTPNPNVFVARGDVTAETCAALLADPVYGDAAILSVEEKP